MNNDNKNLKLLIFICSIAVITLSGWLCDDAYHGFVMAKHLAEGNGFVYNIGERVNASTCPLFTLIIAALYAPFMNGMYFIAMGTCIIFSGLCVWLMIYKICKDKYDLLFFVLIFCSKSFISFTTSGLENPLLFLLGIMFFLVMFNNNNTYDKGRLFTLSLLSGLIALTRMDNILIYLPFLIYCFFIRRNRVSRLTGILIGFAGVLPFIAWEIFSVLYYGFPFPNTYYVKLGTGITLMQYILKGLQHVLYNLMTDPAVVIIPVIYGFLGLFIKDIRHKLLALGILLYMVYVVRIGGDFMAGRHFTVIYVISAACFITLRHQTNNFVNSRFMILTSLACLLFSVTLADAPISHFYNRSNSGGTSDQRYYYFINTSLVRNTVRYFRNKRLSVYNTWSHNAVDELKASGFKRGIIGFAGGVLVYENSDLYLGDAFGIGDPLLSHLPLRHLEGINWRIAHVARKMPEGYSESVKNDSNEIVNPALHEYYDVIRLITRGELFSPERIKAIININLGRYDHLIKQYISDTQEKNNAL